jgi:hypothetical protein
MKDRKIETIHIKVDYDRKNKLRRFAKENNMSITGFIKTVIDNIEIAKEK